MFQKENPSQEHGISITNQGIESIHIYVFKSNADHRLITYDVFKCPV
jgi:hypothetical protein